MRLMLTYENNKNPNIIYQQIKAIFQKSKPVTKKHVFIGVNFMRHLRRGQEYRR